MFEPQRYSTFSLSSLPHLHQYQEGVHQQTLFWKTSPRSWGRSSVSYETVETILTNHRILTMNHLVQNLQQPLPPPPFPGLDWVIFHLKKESINKHNHFKILKITSRFFLRHAFFCMLFHSQKVIFNVLKHAKFRYIASPLFIQLPNNNKRSHKQ